KVVRTREFKGSELEYMTAKHPLFDRTSLVVLGEHVTLDGGTGCVHTAPGHGDDDFIIGQKYELGVLSPVDDKGVFTHEAGKYEGLFYDKANKVITEDLEAAGALVKMNFITHSYPHDWRSKTPVISVRHHSGSLQSKMYARISSMPLMIRSSRWNGTAGACRT